MRPPAHRHPAGRGPDPGLLAEHRPRVRCSRSTRTCARRAATGPLVRTLASHLAYYQRWAKTWEFQALLKARPVAGDLRAGPGVSRARSARWSGRPPSATTSSPTCRPCAAGSSDNLPAGEAGRQLKLGPGGLRDIEFAVQLLQLVHGRADETLREPATLPALAALAGGGYVGRARRGQPGRRLPVPAHASSTCSSCASCAAPTPLPEDPAALRRLGRALRRARTRSGAAAPAPPSRADPAAELLAAVAAARPRGPPAAREAVLPAAAGRGGPAARRRGPAHPARRPGPGWRPSATPTRPARCATSRR